MRIDLESLLEFLLADCVQIFWELDEEEVEIYRLNWILIFFVYRNFLKMEEIRVLKNIVEYIQKEYIESKKNL